MAQSLVRDGEPLSLGDDGVDVLAGERLSMERLRVNMQMLSKAAERPDVADLIALAKWSKDELDGLIADYQGLVKDVKNNCGKLIVRYVGDLKHTEYSLNAKLFHLSDTIAQDELSNLLHRALNGGQAEVDFINLANVRDIKVKVGHRAVVGIEDELRYADSVINTLLAWSSAECGARIEDG